ncbi:MAG TPA: SRPBCC family protein [Gammaproteobacteria bacterium]|nr:SRPBCC family protein [Gammaproteobacteria bacterium]
MTKVMVSNEFQINSEKLWEEVRQFNNMHKYLPSMITSCEVRGNGEGAKRVCGTENGEILETLVLLDDSNMVLQYTIDNEDSPLPVSQYTGTVAIKKKGNNLTEFSWSAIFEPKGMSEADVVGMLESAFKGLLEGIVASIRK